MELHTLTRRTPNKTKKRVGRGGARGKTAGKGMKGQKSRTGNSTRPMLRDIIKKIPKLRGHGKNRARTVNAEALKPFGVNVSVLNTHFAAGETVTPEVLHQKKLIPVWAKRPGLVKILGTGDLGHKLTVSSCRVSDSAKEKITAQGGSVEAL